MVAFPRKTVAMTAEQETRLGSLVRAIGWYGVAVGVAARLYRWFVLAVLVPRGTQQVVLELGVGAALICALSAVHLANYTLKRWVWRAPALGAFIALGESATSLVLAFAHQERLGRGVATVADWPNTALKILETRVGLVSVFALVLAGVVAILQKVVQPEHDHEPHAGNAQSR
jgi:hypothetical protein